MNKKGIYFHITIGMLVGLLLSPLIYSHIWKFVSQSYVSLLSAFFGFSIAIVLIVLIRYVLQKIRNQSSLVIPKIVQSKYLVKLIPSLSQTEADELASQAITTFERYLAVRMYKELLAIIFGLILAVAGLTGTYLLIEQNTKIKEQNKLIANQKDLSFISLTTEIREQLKSSGSYSPKNIKYQIVDNNSQVCEIERVHKTYEKGPNESSIETIAYLATNSPLSDQIVESLKRLIFDSSPAVSFGALQIMDRLSVQPDQPVIQFTGLYLNNLRLKSNYHLIFVSAGVKARLNAADPRYFGSDGFNVTPQTSKVPGSPVIRKGRLL